MKPIAAAVAFALIGTLGSAQEPSSALLARIDHLVYATPDLQIGITAIEQLGVGPRQGSASWSYQYAKRADRTRTDELPRDHRPRSGQPSHQAHAASASTI